MNRILNLERMIVLHFFFTVLIGAMIAVSFAYKLDNIHQHIRLTPCGGNVKYLSAVAPATTTDTGANIGKWNGY